MGCCSSTVRPAPEDFPYFCLTFHWTDTLRLVHARPHTIGLLRKCVQKHWAKGLKNSIWHHGCMDLELAGSPFMRGGWHDDSFALIDLLCHALEFLLTEGWCLRICCDMSRQIDLTSWFFEHSVKRLISRDRPAVVCCLRLCGTNNLMLVRVPDVVYSTVIRAINTKYMLGIQNERDMGNGAHQIRLNGNPWISEEEEGMDARRLLLQIVKEMQRRRWKLYGKANTKGTADGIFFIHHPNKDGWIRDGDFCMISLNEDDCLRFVDCPDKVVEHVRTVIEAQRGESWIGRESTHFQTVQFKLNGHPWRAKGTEIANARLMMLKIFEGMWMIGWRLLESIDMSRRMDKCVLLFKSTKPAAVPFMSISPVGADQVWLIGAPETAIETVRSSLNFHYPSGIQKEWIDQSGTYRFKLRGEPFTGERVMHSLSIRSTFCFVLFDLARQGWEVIVSADVSTQHVSTSSSPDYPADVHSWFFARTGNI